MTGAEGVRPSEGWGVLHLFFAIVGPRSEPVDVREAAQLLGELTADEPYQAVWSATLGQRADLGLVLLGPDLERLKRVHAGMLATPFGERLDEVPELSFVSLTEVSEYLPREGDERLREMIEARLHPRLPARRVVAFYPMSKRRDGEENWYRLPFERRRELMYGHGAVGRRYAGRVLQLVTGATGLSDWEWGVTLLADDPKAIKDVVYEMRFDEVSARYAEFGPFTIGLAAPFPAVLELAGLAVADG